MGTKKNAYSYLEVSEFVRGMANNESVSPDVYVECIGIHWSMLMGEFNSAKDVVSRINSCLGEVRY